IAPRLRDLAGAEEVADPSRASRAKRNLEHRARQDERTRAAWLHLESHEHLDVRLIPRARRAELDIELLVAVADGLDGSARNRRDSADVSSFETEDGKIRVRERSRLQSCGEVQAIDHSKRLADAHARLGRLRSEEDTYGLQSRDIRDCRLLLE